MMTNLPTDAFYPPWRNACTPHRDIRDPTLFFERTHLTRTLKGLIRDVLTPGARPRSGRRGWRWRIWRGSSWEVAQ